MIRTTLPLLLSAAILTSAACHPGSIVNTDPTPSADGTIAGVIRSGATPVVGRTVTATDVATGRSFTAITAANGGYTIKVPAGKYKLDAELRPGETFAKRPDETTINKSDLDSGRDFEISATATVRQN